MQKPVEKPIKFVKNLETKGKSYPVTHVSAVIDDENKSIGQLIANLKKGQTLIETTSEELKTQRDNGELLVGSLYRITDTANAFPVDSPYYGKQLDVILVATSPNTLSEEGYAMMHNNVYDVTFLQDVKSKCYVYPVELDGDPFYNFVDVNTLLGAQYEEGSFEIDEDNKKITVYGSWGLDIPNLKYNDFQDENLDSWKVWYNLDSGLIYDIKEGAGTVTKLTWQELKDKRDNGELTPGSLYRITDYNCTTTQENTQSAGHQFDIVLLALSANKLAEEGWAMMHDNIYDVTFATGETVKCFLHKAYINSGIQHFNLIRCDSYKGVVISSQNITSIDNSLMVITVNIPLFILTMENLTYNYFQNSNLSAWKVWYCLDNDTARFAWADDSVDISSITIDLGANMVCTRKEEWDMIYEGNTYFAWYNSNINTVYTLSQIPTTSDKIFMVDREGNPEEQPDNIVNVYQGTNLPNGRGVIYRLIDEWGNDVCFDFKNIMGIGYYTSHQFDPNGTPLYSYLFTYIDNSDTIVDHSLSGNVKKNIIGDCNTENKLPLILFCIYSNQTEIKCNKIKFATGTVFNGPCEYIEIGTAEDNFISQCNNITIGNGFSYNFLTDISYSTFGHWCRNLTLSSEEYLNYGNNGVELATKDDL